MMVDIVEELRAPDFWVGHFHGGGKLSAERSAVVFQAASEIQRLRDGGAPTPWQPSGGAHSDDEARNLEQVADFAERVSEAAEMRAYESAVSKIALAIFGPVARKAFNLLTLLDGVGGKIDGSDKRLDWFCDDLGEYDTFNHCIDAGYIAESDEEGMRVVVLRPAGRCLIDAVKARPCLT